MSSRNPGFRDRVTLARIAWNILREQIPNQPIQPPPLFEAGFTLGMVTQADQEIREGMEGGLDERQGTCS